MNLRDVLNLANQAGNAYYGVKQDDFNRMFKEFQMQKQTEELQMQKEMHDIESKKLQAMLRQQQKQDEMDSTPAAAIVKLFGGSVPEGAENVTVGQARYAAPVAEVFRKKEESQEREKDREEARKDKRDMFTLSLLDKQEARKQQEQLRRDSLAQNERHHQDNMALRESLASMALSLRQRLPATKVKEVSDKKNEINRYTKLLDEFVDKYGGDVLLGPTKTQAYEKLGMNKDRVNWWKQFRALDVRLRHDLFGATLTAGEQKAWDLVTVNENSDPSIIKEQMKLRANIAASALERDLDSYEQGGYGVQGLKSPDKGKQGPSPKATHKYVPGKGLVPVGG